MSEDLAIMACKVFLYYGKNEGKPILDGLNINIPNGGIYGLVGPSGCGKTTLLKCITGQLCPKRGEIYLYGKIPNSPGFCIPGKGLGYMPQDIALNTGITIEEAFYYFGKLYFMSDIEIKDSIVTLSELMNIPGQSSLISNLSGGQQRRVSLAVTLLHHPPLLILDEPTAGVDPILREGIWNYLEELVKKECTTIVITTHYLEEAHRADTVGMMNKGRLLVEANTEDLLKSYQTKTLESIYLNVCKDTGLQNEMPSLLDGKADFGPFVSSCSKNPSNEESKLNSETMHHFEQEVCPDTKDSSKLRGHESKDVLNVARYRVYKKLICEDTSFAKLRKTISKIRAVTLKNLFQFKRNRKFGLFMLLTPILQVLLFSCVVGRQLTNLPMAYVNLDSEGNFGKIFIDKLNKKVMNMVPFTNMQSAVKSVKNGNTWGVLEIGPNFTTAITERYIERHHITKATMMDSSLDLHLDVTDQLISDTILYNIKTTFMDFMEHIFMATNISTVGLQFPIAVKDRIYGWKDTTYKDYAVPSLAVGLACALSIALSAVTIIIEKKDGMLDRTFIAGVRHIEMLLGILCSMFLVTILQNILEIIALSLFAQLTLKGSYIWIYVCLAFSSMTGIAIGLFISTVCSTEFQATVLSISAFSPILVYSGILWPIESMPPKIRSVVYLISLTSVADAMRSICSRGWSMMEQNLWVSLVIQCLFTAVFLLFSIKFMKKI